jgi:hypothetical protein
LPDTNTLAYFSAASGTKKKEFYKIFGPAVNPFTDKRNFEKERERERERKCKRKKQLSHLSLSISHYSLALSKQKTYLNK